MTPGTFCWGQKCVAWADSATCSLMYTNFGTVPAFLEVAKLTGMFDSRSSASTVGHLASLHMFAVREEMLRPAVKAVDHMTRDRSSSLCLEGVASTRALQYFAQTQYIQGQCFDIRIDSIHRPLLCLRYWQFADHAGIGRTALLNILDKLQQVNAHQDALLTSASRRQAARKASRGGRPAAPDLRNFG